MLEIVDKIPVILNALPYILQGSVVTLITVIGSLALGFCIGLPLAVLQVCGFSGECPSCSCCSSSISGCSRSSA